ncbi:MAG: hypothetical protein KKE02_14125 [Alphaproteobacteria bacterium]|nr:hypothetical protein [Alphaproteobacteria bacterium]MBU1513303.1 hypothetical protein [Alphaproteobacteria bacterium]MBU2095922.1 hypothetical protein [Alphaproteobacteria bacterium]MBU2152152.1 hypothetical protein [Alphaproteobacteria bacterium]MBU2306192.1 hypothetical protein [Alphaproteobacteria bacterium]
MRTRWKADRHADGWAVYRSRRGRLEAFHLPAEPTPVIFDSQHAAVVWAKILNEVVKAGAARRRAELG